MTLRLQILSLAVCLGATGCAEFQELKIDYRNRYLAKEAWESLQETYDCMNYEKDFGRGFRQGYYEVAMGGNGCPPVLPPRRYWSVRYMSMEGRARTEAWFAGFRYGALVAEQDGVGIFMQLPTSVPTEESREKTPTPPLSTDVEPVPPEAQSEEPTAEGSPASTESEAMPVPVTPPPVEALPSSPPPPAPELP